VITMEMIGKVRRMKLREQLSNSEIAKRTGLSRNTVKKWLKAPGDQTPKYKRQSGFTKLSAFEGTLVQALKADSHRPKHARRSARALLTQLQAQGYRGGYSRLTDFIRAWREQEGKAASKAYVPLNFELGEAFQFDWSEEGLLIGGVYHHMQVSHLKLCASRAFWVVAYPSQGHEMLFDAHTRSFTALGGVARRGIYDNMKTAVDKVKKGKGRIVNARFNALFKSNDLACRVKLLCKYKTYINQQLTLQKSLPLNRSWRLAGHVVGHAVDAAHFVDDASRYLFQQRVRQLGPVGSHEV
jgi:transposase